METLKTHWKEIVLIILIGLLIVFLPFTNRDWFWINAYKSFNSVKTIFNFQLIPALIASVLGQVKFIRVIVYVISFISLLLIIQNMTNKKNGVLAFISLFLFFLINEEVLFTGFISLYGFSEHFIPIIFTLMIVYLVLKDELYKIPKVLLVIIGIVSASFNITYSFVQLAMLSLHLINLLLKKEKNKYFYLLYSGSLLGNIGIFLYNILNKIIVLADLSENILHIIIPSIFKMDFIVSLILISFLLFLSIKIYISNIGYKRIITILSLIIILLYSLMRIFSNNDILNYVSWILFEGASVFILLNANNRLAFKNRIKVIFTIKWFYLLFLLLKTIDISNMMFIELINIIIVIGIIDYIFPEKFMTKSWFLICVMILILNIYLFKDIYTKTIGMNSYIKNHLECGYYKVYLPHKYYNSYKTFVLPANKDEEKDYLKYLNIDSHEFKIIIEDE